MRKGQIVVLVVLLAVITVVVFGEEKPTPKLNAEVHLSLVKDQNDIYRTVLNMKDLEAKYQQATAQLKAQQAQFQGDLKDAVAKSGLDAAKYEINADTLEVTPKLKVADASVPGKEAEKAVSQ